MQTVFLGDSLNELSLPVFWENKKNISEFNLQKFVCKLKHFSISNDHERYGRRDRMYQVEMILLRADIADFFFTLRMLNSTTILFFSLRGMATHKRKIGSTLE